MMQKKTQKCEFCGGVRLNGNPLRKTDEGHWVLNHGTHNPASEYNRLACRSCVREQLDAAYQS